MQNVRYWLLIGRSKVCRWEKSRPETTRWTIEINGPRNSSNLIQKDEEYHKSKTAFTRTVENFQDSMNTDQERDLQDFATTRSTVDIYHTRPQPQSRCQLHLWVIRWSHSGSFPSQVCWTGWSRCLAQSVPLLRYKPYRHGNPQLSQLFAALHRKLISTRISRWT